MRPIRTVYRRLNENDNKKQAWTEKKQEEKKQQEEIKPTPEPVRRRATI